MAYGCSGLAGQLAAAGPAAGSDRSNLCVDTFQCILTTGCVENNTATACYCGTAEGLHCLVGQADGACKAAEEAGLETTDPSVVPLVYGSAELGAGRANLLAQCLSNFGCLEVCGL